MVIFNVMNCSEYVGTFYCGSFSTREKAQAHMDKLQTSIGGDGLYIDEYLVDTDE